MSIEMRSATFSVGPCLPFPVDPLQPKYGGLFRLLYSQSYGIAACNDQNVVMHI